MAVVQEFFTQDGLIAGDHILETDVETLENPSNLSRGAVLGKVTATSRVKLVDGQASDGSQNPRFILTAAISTTGSPVSVGIYKSGDFNDSKISLGGTTVAADVKVALRNLAIYLKTPGER